jgi:hypothetical protein
VDQIRHPHHARLTLLKERDARRHPDISWKSPLDVGEQAAIDLLDDLQMSRKKVLRKLAEERRTGY